MHTYNYRAATRSGEIIAGNMTVADLSELKDRLDYAGLSLIDHNDIATRTLANILNEFKSRLSTAFISRKADHKITTFLQELSLLLSAEIRLDRALKMLEESADNTFSSMVPAINSALANGSSLSEALAQQPRHFDPLTVALVKIGETSGTLAQVLTTLADQRERNATFRRNTIQPLRYPAFLLFSALIVLIFFFSHILPQFVDIFKDFDTKTDPFVHGLLAFIKWTEAHSFHLRSFFIFSILFIFLGFISRSVKQRLITILLRIPFVTEIKKQYRTVLFCRLLALTIKGGLGVTQSITLISNVIGSEADRSIWLDVYDKVRHGTPLNEALNSADLIANTAIRLLKIGEETGQLAHLSSKAALFHETRLERRLNNITGMIGPAAIIFISSLVGGIIVTLMTSLVSIGQIVR